MIKVVLIATNLMQTLGCMGIWDAEGYGRHKLGTIGALPNITRLNELMHLHVYIFHLRLSEEPR